MRVDDPVQFEVVEVVEVAARDGLADVQPGPGGERGHGAGVVAGEDLERHAFGPEAADALRDLGPELVGERDEGDRLERRQHRVAGAVAQPGAGGPRQQQHPQPPARALGDGTGREGFAQAGGERVGGAQHPGAVLGDQARPAQRRGEGHLVAHRPRAALDQGGFTQADRRCLAVAAFRPTAT